MPKSVTKYWLIFRSSILEVFEYRLDFVLHVSKYAIMILLMSLVWIAVAKENHQLGLNQAQLTAYFFFAAILYSLSNFHTYYIEDDIKLGHISKFLVKPLSAYWNYWHQQAGHAFIETMVKVVVMLPLLAWLGIEVHWTITKVIMLLVFIPVIYSFTFAMLACISTLSFWLSESWAIRWATLITVRFLAGMFVPYTFFAESFRRPLFFLPFPHLAFTPINFIIGQGSFTETATGLAILTLWAAVMFATQQWLWNKGLRAYEGNGV